MSELKDLPLICLESRNGDGYPKTPHPSRSFQEGTKLPPQEPCLKTAYLRGAEIHKANSTALAAKLGGLYKLSTKTPKETNELFLKSLRNTFQENISSLKELSELNQNNPIVKAMLNKEKSAFLNNLRKAHSLGLLRVVPEQQKESDIESPIFTSGEIKLHHSIDPGYLVSSRDRSKLHFMIMNNENSQSSSEPILRIFSDEGNHKNPFYHLNIEFTGTLPQNKASINDLFGSANHILEYLFEHKLGTTASPKDNLNLLKSINELLSAQKSEPLVSSGQIKSAEAFNGRPFYIDKLFNTSQKPLDFHRAFINTGNLKIEFLIFNNKDKNSIPKLNLKLTDTIRGHSKSFLLDAEVAPELKNSFREYLNNFITFIEKKESKLRSTNSPQLKRPEPPPSKA